MFTPTHFTPPQNVQNAQSNLLNGGFSPKDAHVELALHVTYFGFLIIGVYIKSGLTQGIKVMIGGAMMQCFLCISGDDAEEPWAAGIGRDCRRGFSLHVPLTASL